MLRPMQTARQLPEKATLSPITAQKWSAQRTKRLRRDVPRFHPSVPDSGTPGTRHTRKGAKKMCKWMRRDVPPRGCLGPLFSATYVCARSIECSAPWQRIAQSVIRDGRTACASPMRLCSPLISSRSLSPIRWTQSTKTSNGSMNGTQGCKKSEFARNGERRAARGYGRPAADSRGTRWPHNSKDETAINPSGGGAGIFSSGMPATWTPLPGITSK